MLEEKSEGLSKLNWFRNLGKKKKLLLISSVVIIVLGIIILCIYLVWVKQNSNSMGNMRSGMEQFGEGIVTASGLTGTGMTEEECNFDYLETTLYVEESYLSVGNEVEAGTKVFKISEESMEEAKQELTDAVTKTGLAYRQGIIDYETGKSEAENTKQQAEISKKYAQAEYDNAISQEKTQVEELKKQVKEADELYKEYIASVEVDYYYTYYNVEALQDTYSDNFTYLMQLYEVWDVEGLKDRVGNTSSTSASTSTSSMGTGDMQGAPGGGQTKSTNQDAEKLSVYEMMEELVDKNGEEYETALENYEKDKLMAAASLEQAKSNLAVLQADLSDAELTYEKKKITSQADYDTTLAESENAQNVYTTAIQQLDEDLEELKEAKEDAKENLNNFEDLLGDGYFYTKSAGTIVMNQVKAKSNLAVEDILLAYSNPETVSVEASVAQADIAKLSIGDSAYVSVSGYGNYEGKVISINPISSSGGHSSITYTVTVELEGDLGEMESNLTASVYFGLTKEQMEGMSEPAEEKGFSKGGYNSAN